MARALLPILLLGVTNCVFGQQRDIVADLLVRVSVVCPVKSVGVPDPATKAGWFINPAPAATAQQQSNAASVIATFDASPYIGAGMVRTGVRMQLFQARTLFDAMAEELNADPGNAALQADIAMQQARIAVLRALAKQ